MTKPPEWTPPINGWQYPIGRGGIGTFAEVRCRTAGNFELFHSRHGDWCAHINVANGELDAYGTLDFCCAVLDAALKARK